jgi:hypothetical protein
MKFSNSVVFAVEIASSWLRTERSKDRTERELLTRVSKLQGTSEIARNQNNRRVVILRRAGDNQFKLIVPNLSQ